MTALNDDNPTSERHRPTRRGIRGAFRRWLRRERLSVPYSLRSTLYALPLLGLVFALTLDTWVVGNEAIARLSSDAVVAVGAEYNDNIFFEQDGEDDFIFFINPTLRLRYEPGLGANVFSAAISSPLQIFTQHSDQSNFGDNILFNLGYEHQYSPRLTFYVQNNFRRVGRTRTAINAETSGVSNQAPGTPADPVFTGDSSLVNRGEYLTNVFSTRFNYEYTRDITINGGYSVNAQIYIDEGGNSTSQSVGVGASYRLNEKWSIPFGYRLGYYGTRDGGDDVVHNFDFGGSYQDEIIPTVTVFFSTGLGINTRGGGPAVVNNINAGLTKSWEASQASLRVTRGLTNSDGVSGLSTTTTVSGDYTIQLTRDLSAFASARAAFFDTSDVDYNTVQAQVGLGYQINSWLSSSLRYLYFQRNAGSGAENTDLQTSGRIATNSIMLFFSAAFDLWPTTGFSKGPGITEAIGEER